MASTVEDARAGRPAANDNDVVISILSVHISSSHSVMALLVHGGNISITSATTRPTLSLMQLQRPNSLCGRRKPECLFDQAVRAHRGKPAGTMAKVQCRAEQALRQAASWRRARPAAPRRSTAAASTRIAPYSTGRRESDRFQDDVPPIPLRPLVAIEHLAARSARRDAGPASRSCRRRGPAGCRCGCGSDSAGDERRHRFGGGRPGAS